MQNNGIPKITCHEHLMILDYNFDKENCKKFALFDLDSTLLKYYPKDIQRFEYMYPSVPIKLQSLHNDGYKLFIISNQSLAIENNEIELIKTKLQKFIQDVNLPFLIYLSLGHNKFRKPCTGIYDHIVKHYGTRIEDIFYVGDAAGPRLHCYTAYTDIKFAYNCNIKFYTPEEYFLGVQENKTFELFDVTKYEQKNLQIVFKPKIVDYVFIFSTKKYSGVSFFINKYYKGYTFNNTKKLEKRNIYVNCNDLSLIKSAKQSAVFYLLDYPTNLLSWTKGFFYCSGMYYKKKFTPIRKNILIFLKDLVIKVPFIYDESSFTDEQKKIARLQLC